MVEGLSIQREHTTLPVGGRAEMHRLWSYRETWGLTGLAAVCVLSFSVCWAPGRCVGLRGMKCSPMSELHPSMRL